MKFLDITGVNTLWNKIKNYVSTNVINKIGIANGIAQLDANSKLPTSQLPNLKTINGTSIIGSGNITIDLGLYKIVTSLPTSGIDVNKIYLVVASDSTETNNIYKEYVYVNNKWELLGEYKAEVNLTNYVKFTDVATQSKNGVLSKEDKIKLDSINVEDIDNVFIIPESIGNKIYVEEDVNALNDAIDNNKIIIYKERNLYNHIITYADNTRGNIFLFYYTSTYMYQISIVSNNITIRPFNKYIMDYLDVRNNIIFQDFSDNMKEIETKSYADFDDFKTFVQSGNLKDLKINMTLPSEVIIYNTTSAQNPYHIKYIWHIENYLFVLKVNTYDEIYAAYSTQYVKKININIDNFNTSKNQSYTIDTTDFYNYVKLYNLGEAEDISVFVNGIEFRITNINDTVLSISSITNDYNISGNINLTENTFTTNIFPVFNVIDKNNITTAKDLSEAIIFDITGDSVVSTITSFAKAKSEIIDKHKSVIIKNGDRQFKVIYAEYNQNSNILLQAIDIDSNVEYLVNINFDNTMIAVHRTIIDSITETELNSILV